MANRLAKSRDPDPPSPSSLILTPVGNPMTPFSAGALYSFYQQDEPVPALNSQLTQVAGVASVENDTDSTSSKHSSPTPHIASKTPAWLKPLRLVGNYQFGNPLIVIGTGFHFDSSGIS